MDTLMPWPLRDVLEVDIAGVAHLSCGHQKQTKKPPTSVLTKRKNPKRLACSLCKHLVDVAALGEEE